MKLIQQRIYHTTTLAAAGFGDYTCGFLTNTEHSFRSFVLEDTKQPGPKIRGITRIPEGFYELALRRELTESTIRHRAAYHKAQLPWFVDHPEWWHIEIMRIQDFSSVYYHAGTDDKDTLGCPLPCYDFNIRKQDRPAAESGLATNDLYAVAYPLLDRGEKVHVQIIDETH